MPKSLPKLFTSIVLCQLAGIVGSFFTISSIGGWYETLNQPYFRPPNSLFGPVWIILYTLMGISFYWIWIKKSNTKTKEAIKLFVLHLIINSLWSIVFFGLQQIFLGLIVIVMLLVTLLMVMRKFWSIDGRATGILFPYLVWVTFATVLNFAIWILNR